MTQRIQKIIAEAGLLSRRAAEEAIRAGRVTVNGRRAQLGESADAETDEIRLDGARLPAREETVTVLLHKPRGFVCTMSDEKGRRTVGELVALPQRLYPVGRLDLNSEGLLLMTNDGALAYALTHPKHEVPKTYRVWVRGEMPETAAERLRRPMTLDGRPLANAKTRLLSVKDGTACVEITIREGRNRQVRRMCELQDLYVTRLLRTAEGPLRLGELPVGQWRYLTEAELAALRSEGDKGLHNDE